MKFLYMIVFLSLSTVIFSFGQKEVIVDAKNKLVVALILDQPGLGDDSSNDGCYIGLQQAADEGIITLRVKTSKGSDDSTNILNSLVSEGVDALFMIGEQNRQLLLDAAAQYQETLFFGVDVIYSDREIKKNLMGMTFKEQDGGYLAGLVAGELTYKYNKKHPYLNEQNRVGIILGKSSPDIKRYELGFFAGVKKVNQACEIISINLNDMNNSKKGRDAVIDLKEKGVDLIFSVAGGSDEGVFNAAEENNILVIGANKDLSRQSENILTSVVKKISVSTYLMIKEYTTIGLENGGNRIYGLNEGAISLAPYYNFDRFISKDLRVLISDMSKKLSNSSKIIPESIELIEFNIENVPTIVE